MHASAITSRVLISVAALSLAGCFSSGGTDPAPGGPPVINAVAPTGSIGVPARTITFSARASNSPTTFSWTFGGGATPNTATEATPAVVLGSAGSFNGTVTATNSAGTSASFPFSFTVTSAPQVPSNDASGSGTADQTGGTIDFGDLEIDATPPALTAETTFEADTVPLPESLPTGFTALTEPIEVTVSPDDTFESSVTLLFLETLPFDIDDDIFVLRFDESTDDWEPVPALEANPFEREVTTESQVFGVFVVARED